MDDRNPTMAPALGEGPAEANAATRPTPNGHADAPAGALRVPGLAFDNRFARLPDGFFARVRPAPLPEPWLVAASDEAAASIGLPAAAFEDPAMVDALAGNRPLAAAEPLAAVDAVAGLAAAGLSAAGACGACAHAVRLRAPSRAAVIRRGIRSIRWSRGAAGGGERCRFWHTDRKSVV